MNTAGRIYAINPQVIYTAPYPRPHGWDKAAPLPNYSHHEFFYAYVTVGARIAKFLHFLVSGIHGLAFTVYIDIYAHPR